MNCGVGPLVCLDALTGMGRPSVTLARSIMPNAGLPQRVEGQFVYAAGPDYFGEAVPRFLAAGARLIGGCCGTRPEHIAAMRQALDRTLAREAGTAAAAAGATGASESPRTALVEVSAPGGPEPPPPTGLAQKLADGDS